MTGERDWYRVLGPGGEVLEEGPILRHEAPIEWKEQIRLRHRLRPLTIEVRRGGEWLYVRTIRA
jgi:hypothetical protein